MPDAIMDSRARINFNLATRTSSGAANRDFLHAERLAFLGDLERDIEHVLARERRLAARMTKKRRTYLARIVGDKCRRT